MESVPGALAGCEAAASRSLAAVFEASAAGLPSEEVCYMQGLVPRGAAKTASSDFFLV